MRLLRWDVWRPVQYSTRTVISHLQNHSSSDVKVPERCQNKGEENMTKCPFFAYVCLFRLQPRPEHLMPVRVWSICTFFIHKASIKVPARQQQLVASGWSGETRCWQQTGSSRVRLVQLPLNEQHVGWCPTKWCLLSGGSLGLRMFWAVYDSYVWQCAQSVCIHGLRIMFWFWFFFWVFCVCAHTRAHAWWTKSRQNVSERSAGPANSICQVSPVGAAATVIAPPHLSCSQNGRLAR